MNWQDFPFPVRDAINAAVLMGFTHAVEVGCLLSKHKKNFDRTLAVLDDYAVRSSPEVAKRWFEIRGALRTMMVQYHGSDQDKYEDALEAFESCLSRNVPAANRPTWLDRLGG